MKGALLRMGVQQYPKDTRLGNPIHTCHRASGKLAPQQATSRQQWHGYSTRRCACHFSPLPSSLLPSSPPPPPTCLPGLDTGTRGIKQKIKTQGASARVCTLPYLLTGANRFLAGVFLTNARERDTT